MLNIRHARIASSCPLPCTFACAKLNAIMVYVVSRWQGVSRCSTSGYEKLDSLCFKMKCRISSSVGAVKRNKENVTLFLTCGLRRRLEVDRYLCDEAAN
jgi:hypothetical protein